MCWAPPPRPQLPPPRLGASRLAPAFPVPLCGTLRRTPGIGGLPLGSRRRGRLVGGGVTVSSPGGLLVCPAPPLPPPPQRGRGRRAGLSSHAPLPLLSLRPARPLPRGLRTSQRRSPRAGSGGGLAAALSARRRARAFLGAGRSGQGRGEPGPFLLGGGGWPLAGTPRWGRWPRACSPCLVVLPAINFTGVVLALTLPLAEPRAGRAACAGRRGAGQGLRYHGTSRRGLCRRSGGTRGAWSARLRSGAEPARDGRI